MNTRYFVIGFILVLLSGCVLIGRMQLDEQYGSPDPAFRSAAARQTHGIDYFREVRPIIERRCAVCHGCYDAPCQLKLTSYEGLERGASKKVVYNGTRLTADPLTRLFIDASSAKEWRDKEFYPVLNERAQTPEANLAGSVLYKMLELKRKNPLPQTKQLPESFDFRLDREQKCSSIEEFDKFAKDCPYWGMPYGFPAIDDKDFEVLKRWLEQGSPYSEPPPLSEEYSKRIASWEEFLNGDSKKEQLVSRYIYEHLFLAHFYFDDLAQGEYFKLVRSTTPPGEPVQVIATRRVYDDPGVERTYYRLEKVKATVVSKIHMPYALGKTRMARWRELFLDADFKVSEFPSYQPEVASNPFLAFRELPEISRYKFMLDEAQFSIMGFIKGPVCRGQVALDVINDQFWIVFAHPDWRLWEKDVEFLAQETRHLRLPAERESETLFLANWLEYSKLQREYLKAKSEFLKKNLADGRELTLNIVWDGDGRNPNAALTIFRHFDSASVVKGFVGAKPKTAWLIGYSLLERIHYLLVAGFDVYGNYGHQALTRLYMDFLRMEGESQFLALLPPEVRKTERDYWYRGAEDTAKEFVLGMDDPYGSRVGIEYQTEDPKSELFDKLKQHLSAAISNKHDVFRSVNDREVLNSLQQLMSLRGHSVSILPQTVFVDIAQIGIFTLIPNSAHSNITSLIGEKENRLPDEDTLTVSRGFVGAYPNIFWRVDRQDLPQLVDQISALQDEEGYRQILDKYGIRRTDPRFWEVSDELHARYKELSPIEAGLFDYNRYENR